MNMRNATCVGTQTSKVPTRVTLLFIPYTVVLGGNDDQGELKPVESFNFERNTWQELPEMSQARHLHTAVVV